jgi:hypothetical protein
VTANLFGDILTDEASQITRSIDFQVFNARNDHNGAVLPSAALAKMFFPGVPVTRELGEHEALFSNRKIREVLGFKEQHNWRKYVEVGG